jgi:hypothetical protein
MPDTWTDINQYFAGRRESHGLECSPQIEANGAITVQLVNKLLDEAARFGVVVRINEEPGPYQGTRLNSGWRPPSINACTNGAAPNSMHMTAEACDVHDPDGALDSWLMTPEGQYTLEQIGLWMEHPDATPTWAHVQCRPPKSGHRVFYP